MPLGMEKKGEQNSLKSISKWFKFICNHSDKEPIEVVFGGHKNLLTPKITHVTHNINRNTPQFAKFS